jgi:hypothetical protein
LFHIPYSVNNLKLFSFITLTVSRLTRRLLDTNQPMAVFIPEFVPFSCPSVVIYEYFSKLQVKVIPATKPFVIQAVITNQLDFSIL